MKIKGKNYKQRLDYQTDEWVKGNPIHNDVENECCPDFSCCKPSLLVDKDVRVIFKAANYDQKQSFLFSFFSASLESICPDKKIHLATGKDEINSLLN